MKSAAAVAELNAWSREGVTLFTSADLGKVFGESGETLRSTLKRLVKDGYLAKVARNLYLYLLSAGSETYLIERIAVMLRRGEYAFESLESAASKWGIVSQVPVDRITVMTTGRSGEFRTPFGTVEFVHTQAALDEIAANIVERPGNPLPIATKRYTVQNLKNCHRNTHLIDWEEIDNV